MHERSWAQPKGLDLGVPPLPQRPRRSQGWGSAVSCIPHAGEMKSRVFLPSPPTRGSGAKYISHCTQHTGRRRGNMGGNRGRGRSWWRCGHFPQGCGRASGVLDPIPTPCACGNGGFPTYFSNILRSLNGDS
ncbi:hypothetical protein Q9966_006335 [Columba livia]|nr:hypothetical protein Q9966_006335 [Columba livia]